MNTKSPRLSVNKLAEYMTANPLRRKQIIKDAKYPTNFKQTRYSEARDGVKQFILNGLDENVIDKYCELIGNKHVESQFQRDNVFNSLLSLEALLDTDLPSFNDEISIIESNLEVSTVNINGLAVSINPDLIIQNKKNNKIGGLKIHIIKSYPLEEQNLKCVATLIKYLFLSNDKTENEIDNSLCISLDVFGKKFEVAPKSYKASLNRVSAACEEISDRWERI